MANLSLHACPICKHSRTSKHHQAQAGRCARISKQQSEAMKRLNAETVQTTKAVVPFKTVYNKNGQRLKTVFF